MDTCDAATGRLAWQGEAAHGPGRADAAALELAALRERLRAVEAALDLPARPGRPGPPSLPALLARVAALERRAGLAPGLAPLPGHDGSARLHDDPTTPTCSRRQGWRERGPGLLATALALALCAWLFRPPPGHVASALPVTAIATATVTPPAALTPARVRAMPPASPAAAWLPAAVVAPAVGPTVPWLPCDAAVGGFCAAEAQVPPPPTAIPGESPCPRGGTAPCGGGASAPPAAATPCGGAAGRAIGGAGCAGAPPTAPPGPCPLPDERVCMAER